MSAQQNKKSKEKTTAAAKDNAKEAPVAAASVSATNEENFGPLLVQKLEVGTKISLNFL